MEYNYLFGPVPSRRLGRSLGIEVVPHKVCSYDCTYCQVGRTTQHTIERSEFVPLDEVVAELEHWLEHDGQADFLTLSGSGEPTLYSKMGELIEAVARRSTIPVCVITNGSLLWMPQVRRELMQAAVVIPSLDAPTPELFAKVNRPHPAIDFATMVEGIVQFAREFKGALWLELLLVRGIISTPEEIEQLGSLVDRIAPERIQLNTVVRPPADSGVQAVDTTILAAMASRLGAAAEIIANPPPSAEDGHRAASSEEVLELIRRHPCSLEDICRGLLISHVMAQTLVDALLGQQRIASSVVGGTQFYIDPHQLPGSVG